VNAGVRLRLRLLLLLLLLALITWALIFPRRLVADGGGQDAGVQLVQIEAKPGADRPAGRAGQRVGGAIPTLPVVVSLAVTCSVACAVAVRRSNHVAFERVFSQGLVYLAVSTLLLAAYFISLTLLAALIPLSIVGRVMVAASVALAAAAALRPLQDRVQRLAHRFFYGGWYDYPDLVEQVGQALAGALEPETLVDVLVRRVPLAMHLPGAALWLERGGDMDLAAASGMDVPSIQAWARGSGATVLDELELTGSHAMVPLTVGSQVVGLWMLGARPAGEWGPEDGRILAALGRQAALAAQDVRLMTALRVTVEEVEEMQRRLLAAREEERADLARDLHDGVVQDLIGLRYRLESLEEEEGEDAAQVGEMHARVGVLIEELRRLCSDLRPSVLDRSGLVPALRLLAHDLTARGLPVDVHLADLSLPDEVAIGLYRIAQEALSNAWRHAEASRATVTLTRRGNEVLLTVVDNGRGFDLDAVQGRDGCFGLRGMQERAEALEGDLEIESVLGEGARVTVRCDVPGRQVRDGSLLRELAEGKARRRTARDGLRVSGLDRGFRWDL